MGISVYPSYVNDNTTDPTQIAYDFVLRGKVDCRLGRLRQEHLRSLT